MAMERSRCAGGRHAKNHLKAYCVALVIGKVGFFSFLMVSLGDQACLLSAIKLFVVPSGWKCQGI